MSGANRHVIIIGDLANYDFTLGELLLRYDIPFYIYRQEDPTLLLQKYPFKLLSRKNFIIGTRTELLTAINKGDVVISITNAFFRVLGVRRFLYSLLIKKIVHIHYQTGADITELFFRSKIEQFCYRNILKNGKFNVFTPYPKSIEFLKKINDKNFFILRYPYLVHERSMRDYKQKEDKIIFLHPANIDFGYTDFKLNRNTTKGSNRFFSAFIKAARMSPNIKCVIVDRGPDRLIARKSIQNQGGENYFEWVPNTDTRGLKTLIEQANVVVDQFDVGGFGMISMEAMSLYKPVMSYIEKNCWPLVYAEEPPIINCCTEDEIYNAILDWADKKKLKDLGEKAEKWVRKYHDVHTADFSEFILRVCLAAGLEWPRKDLAKQGA